MNTANETLVNRDSNFKKAKNYILITLGISWLFGFIALEFVDNKSLPFMLTYAFLPSITAIIINKKEGGNWKSLMFIKPNFKSLLLATLIPILYVGIGFYLQELLNIRTAPQWNALGSTSKMILIIVANFVSLLILVLGEEIGWRGYLQEKLINAFGEVKGIIILGIVWGLWHLPVALKGYNFENYTYFEALVTYPIVCIASSFIIAYLGHKRYAIFVGVFLHAANNSFNSIMLAITEVKNELGFILLSTAIAFDLVLIFGYLYWKKTKK